MNRTAHFTPNIMIYIYVYIFILYTLLCSCCTSPGGLWLGCSRLRTQAGDVQISYVYGWLQMIRGPVFHAAMQELCLSERGDGWFNLCSLISQCATGVQPHPALESNQRPPGEAASTSHHTHTHTRTRTHTHTHILKISCLSKNIWANCSVS